MNFNEEYRVKSGDKIKLDSLPTKSKGPFKDKDAAKEHTSKMVRQIQDLQYRMFVEGKQSLLIVLQAPDAAGKDGLIRKVLGQMNPQGCRTYPFKVPSKEELAHDFLWRIHKCTPGKGMVSVFNRSHYEDVLVVRVDDIVPKSVWSKRFDVINHFEENLTLAGTTILKFYLHVSPEEQLERFKKRYDNPEKHWKLNPGDYESRSKWEAYEDAYEDLFSKCSTNKAPWFVIPADNKWYRDASVASIVAETLTKMDPKMPKPDVDLAEIKRLYDEAVAKQQA
ncbi:MAG: polyphosphate kinase 2 family protein [Pirellulaceae bacterium]